MSSKVTDKVVVLMSGADQLMLSARTARRERMLPKDKLPSDEADSIAPLKDYDGQ